jgi:hypothetical protein
MISRARYATKTHMILAFEANESLARQLRKNIMKGNLFESEGLKIHQHFPVIRPDIKKDS